MHYGSCFYGGKNFLYCSQSFDDILDQELRLYFWKGGILESFLRDNFGKGTAAHDLYKAGKGLSSTQEAFDAVKGDRGMFQSYSGRRLE